MAGSAGFSVRIAAVDQATPILDKLNRRIAALTAPAARFNKSLEKFGDVSGISRMSESAATLSRNFLDAFRATDRLGGSVAALTSAGSVAGVTALVARYSELGTAIEKISYRTNMGAGRLTNFENAARLGGSSAAAMDSSLVGLGKALSKATYDGDANTVRTFNALGVSFRDASGYARQAADVLPEVADALKKYPDARSKERALSNLGIDPDLLLVLKDGSKGLQDLQSRARSLGGGMTDQMARDADKTRDSFVGLQEAVEGVENRLADAASGPVTKWMDKTSDWISKNKATADSIAEIGTALSGLMLVKPAAWFLRLIGLGALTGATGTIAGAEGVGAYASYRDGQDSAAAQAAAQAQGYTQVASADDMGLPTAFRNPTTGDVKSTMSFDPRYRGVMNPGGATIASAAPSTPAASVTMDPTKRAFLDTIAGPESRGDYQIKNGGSHFSDMSQFPDYVGPGGTSTASGRYQFTAGTWKSVSRSLGLHDFKPESQDKGGWYLAATAYRAKTGRDLEADLKAGGHDAQIADALKEQWPSLPGGTQSQELQAQFAAALRRNMGVETATAGTGTGAPVSPPVIGAAETPAQAQAHLKVTFENAPAGTRAAIETTGPMTASAPHINMPMTGAW